MDSGLAPPISGSPEIGAIRNPSRLKPTWVARPGMTKDRGAATALVGDKSCLGHQVLVQRIVLLQELEHVLPSEKDRLERLLLHVVLVFGRLRQLLHQVDVERG